MGWGFGIVMMFAGAIYSQGDGATALAFFAAGFTALLCGMISMAVAKVNARVGVINDKLSSIENRLRSQQSETNDVVARQVDAELRDEGLLASDATVPDDDDIVE
jgi:hypothetical protein